MRVKREVPTSLLQEWLEVNSCVSYDGTSDTVARQP